MPATRLKEVDAVTIGVGWTGALFAEALTASGLKVVGIERGRARQTVPDFQAPQIHDELRYGIRLAFMQSVVKEPVAQRHTDADTALPIRRWASFLPGTGLGGAGVHWNGQSWRFNAVDFQLRSTMEERYGKKFVSPDLAIQDWGVTWEEIEPSYAAFERLCGVGGVAGNLKGVIQPGGNPFEGPRSSEYPNPPMKQAYMEALFGQAASRLGYHPVIQPSANITRPYVNPHGIQMNPCMYCGFCEKFGCEHFAKASVQTTLLPVLMRRSEYELRTGCQVLRINLDSTRKKATGVTYIDEAGREFEQPAGIVVLSSFSWNNPRMLMLSGIGTQYDPRTRKGTVGRNYAYQTVSSIDVFWDEKIRTNPFMAAGSSGTVICDFSPGAFDSGPLGFIGGSYILGGTTNGRPIQYHPVPEGTPKWGRDWKEGVIKHYNHTGHLYINGSSMPTWTNYLDLDPTYKDAWGRPVIRMTFDFPDNDIRMERYCHGKALEIARAMGGTSIREYPTAVPFDVTVYQTTHNTGGAIMGADPSTSVVNKYLQSWDVSNLFIPGASAFPHNSCFNPTMTIGALSLHALDKITSDYIKSPGPLVHA
jgi:gluconate 2-dehydrogenase alpha chain